MLINLTESCCKFWSLLVSKRTMGHFILGLHQRLTLKFKTKSLIQSPKTSVKPFLGLNWCKTLVLTWIFGQQLYIIFQQPQGPCKDEQTL